MAESKKKSISFTIDEYEQKVDKDFSDLRKRFDTEIRKVEAEMARFRSELMNKDGYLLQSVLSEVKPKPVTPRGKSKQGNQKNMKLRLDVSRFADGEVLINAADEKLSVQARHEQKLGDKSIYRESSRQFHLPKGVNPNSICSTISEDGVLTVDAPLPDFVQRKVHKPLN